MQNLRPILARLGLVLTVLPPLLFFYDVIELTTSKIIMVFGMILWLGIAPIVQKQHES